MKLFEISNQEHSVLTIMGKQPDYVDGDFSCYGKKLTSLVGAPQSIGGNFYCQRNNLTSLAGSPQSVGRNFDCYYNNLTSLAGCPQSVGRDFKCSYNNLTSLAGCPQSVGRDFYCYNNNITSLHNVDKIVKQIDGTFVCDKATNMLGLALIKGIKRVNINGDSVLTQIFNQYLNDVHLLQDALIDAGYVEQARL